MAIGGRRHLELRSGDENIQNYNTQLAKQQTKATAFNTQKLKTTASPLEDLETPAQEATESPMVKATKAEKGTKIDILA
jgi:hypothetical protein